MSYIINYDSKVNDIKNQHEIKMLTNQDHGRVQQFLHTEPPYQICEVQVAFFEAFE